MSKMNSAINAIQSGVGESLKYLFGPGARVASDISSYGLTEGLVRNYSRGTSIRGNKVFGSFNNGALSFAEEVMENGQRVRKPIEMDDISLNSFQLGADAFKLAAGTSMAIGAARGAFTDRNGRFDAPGIPFI